MNFIYFESNFTKKIGGGGCCGVTDFFWEGVRRGRGARVSDFFH